ncbi:MAG: GTP cyclohydrolase II [Alphaproteobacteria bacterium]|nr:GTP cyclohydrolase II [Alphaproteobacteria bacterium]
MSEPGGQIDAAARALLQADRAAGELRRGRALLLPGEGGGLVAAIEGIGAAALEAMRRLGDGFLVLTPHRAGVLKVRTAVTDPVLLRLEPRMDAPMLRSLADPAADLDHPLQGPFTAERTAPPEAARRLIGLAKRAGLLPAGLLVRAAPERLADFAASQGLLVVPLADLAALEDAGAGRLTPVASARVPLADAPEARIHAFRPADGALEHLAIVIGDPPRKLPVLARIHSECFTGDLLGSLRCDCGEQLRGAIRAIAEAGGGVLLYLAQEGRGIGLMNKLRAYRLQDQGFDTIEANERLGFEADERLFEPAAAMLRHLGFDAVRLMTNNPEKVRQLEAVGIRVAERVPHAFPANAHNEAYLLTKKKRSGHYL